MKRELNTWANVWRVVCVILALAEVCGGIARANVVDDKLWILYGVIVAFVSVVSGFTLAAFLDTTAENANHLANIERNMPQHPKPEMTPPNATLSAIPRKSAPGFITCPRCGESQSDTRTVCFNCGTLFKKD